MKNRGIDAFFFKRGTCGVKNKQTNPRNANALAVAVAVLPPVIREAALG